MCRREDAPQRVHLTMCLRRRCEKRHLPIDMRQRREAILVWEVEERTLIVEHDAGHQALRVQEELVPIVVVGDVRRQEGLALVFQGLLVLAFLGVNPHFFVPFVEDDVVDGADDLREEEAALLRDPGAAVETRCLRRKGELSDEVDRFWHEPYIAGLAPHTQERRHLCQLRRQLLLHVSCAFLGCRVDDLLAECLETRSTDTWQGHRLPRRHARRLVGRQLGAPLKKAVEELRVQVAKGGAEKGVLFDRVRLHGPIRNHCALRAPER
mmetsp:Transcript_118042/g.341271  ORF Transcript_118042/g.341271 Transcript_118042/m.341271 type:complete len:267 (-) Transcript_118042:872-1672(-)